MVLHKVNPAWGRRFALTMFYGAKTRKEMKKSARADDETTGPGGLGLVGFSPALR